MVRVDFSLGGDGVLLVGHRLPGEDVAVLEDDGGVTEHEIDCSNDVAFAVELAVRVCVKCVLETVESASVED